MASNRVAPRAYAPSRCATGTDFSTSRATDEAKGITITARISAADSMPKPSGGPVKNGIDLNDSGTRLETLGQPAQARTSPTIRTRSTESQRAARSEIRAWA